MADDSAASALPADPTLNPLLTGGQYINPAYTTPDMRARLYAYAQQLMQPQPVKNNLQGIAQMVNSLFGGLAMNQANQLEMGVTKAKMADQSGVGGIVQPPGVAPSASPAGAGGASPMAYAPSPQQASSAGGSVSPSDVASYVTQAAASRGIDPKVALAVFNGESGLNPNTRPGDNGSSFGIAQLHYGNVAGGKLSHPGLGDAFTAASGGKLDARDPSTWRQQVDFALDNAKAHGWQPWATTRDKLGIDNFTGISPGNPQTAASAQPAPQNTGVPPIPPGGHSFVDSQGRTIVVDARGNAIQPGQGASAPTPAAPAFAPTGGPAPAPAQAAIGAAIPAAPPANAIRPVQMAQNAAPMPVSSDLYGRIMGSPNYSDAEKAMFLKMVAPTPNVDALGNTSQIYQGRQQGPVVAHNGVLREQTPGAVPSVLGGSPTSPANIIAPPAIAAPIAPQPGAGASAVPPGGGPAVAQNPSGAPNVFGPGSVLGDMKRQQAESEAAAGAVKTAGDVSAKQYSDDLVQAANFPRASLPLTKAIPLLEQLGTQGTGPGSDTWNHAMSFLQTMGVPITDPTKIQAYDEAKKYLTDFVNQTGNSGTNDKLAAAFAGNPSVSISNAAALDVAKTALAMQRMKQAQILAFTAQGDHAPEKYSDFAKQFASSMDPRAFGIDLMTPKARQELLSSPELAKKPNQNGVETNQARLRFLKSLQTAQDTGLISGPPNGR
jgi:hypothetical protein